MAAKALPELEQLAGFCDNLPIAFFVIQERRFCLFNDCLQERLGYSKKELRAIDYQDVVLPDDKQILEEMKEAQSRFTYELRTIRKDGTIRCVAGITTPVQYRGKPANVSFSVDITEHKQRKEQRFKDFADSLPQIIFEIDEKGKIFFSNSYAFDSLGYTPDDLVRGLHVSQVIEQRKMAKERIQRLLSGEKLLPVEYTAQRKDGSTFPVMVYTSRIVRENGRMGVRGIAFDITQQKRLTENKQFYILQTIKAQEDERRRIARELHDETAQALACLLLDIEAMQRVKDEPSKDPWLLLEQFRLKVRNMLVGVRRFSHELRPDVLDQLGLLPALRLLTTELKERSQVNTHLRVVGSPRRLSAEVELELFRIAQEALRNVEKHSQATESVVKVVFSPKKVSLQIVDNGIGFRLPDLLGDFANWGKLGLIGIQERVSLLGGNLELQSEPGKGTTVRVEVAV